MSSIPDSIFNMIHFEELDLSRGQIGQLTGPRQEAGKTLKLWVIGDGWRYLMRIGLGSGKGDGTRGGGCPW